MTGNDRCLFSLCPPRPPPSNVSVQEARPEWEPQFEPQTPVSILSGWWEGQPHASAPERSVQDNSESECHSVPSWALRLPRSALAESLLTATAGKREEAGPGHAGCLRGCRGRPQRRAEAGALPAVPSAHQQAGSLFEPPSRLPQHPIQRQVLPAAPPKTSDPSPLHPHSPGCPGHCHLLCQ